MACAIRILTLSALAGPVAGTRWWSCHRGGRGTAAAPPIDYCGGQCSDILPPGENGNATLADILAHKALGTRPAHAADQLGKYADLGGGYRGADHRHDRPVLQRLLLRRAADQVASTIQPRSDVTIVRDKATGVPHITGTTRVRHRVRRRVRRRAGPAVADGRHAPRRPRPADAVRRRRARATGSWSRSSSRTRPTPRPNCSSRSTRSPQAARAARRAIADAQAYVDGINKYITESHSGRYFPGEYVLTGHVDAITNAGKIDPFKLTDLVGARLGGRRAVRRRRRRRGPGRRREAGDAGAYGVEQGEKVWQGLRAEDDPEAVRRCTTGRTSRTARRRRTRRAWRCRTRVR